MLIRHDQGIGNKLPDVLHFDAKIIFLIERLHDLVTAVMTRRDHQLGTGLGNLPGLDAAVKHPLIRIRQRPGSAACTTAVGTVTVRIQFPHIVAAGLGDLPSFLKICLTKGLQGFSAIITWVMIRYRHGVNRFIELYFPFFDIFEQQIEYGYYFEFLECFRIPSVQPGPGCKIGMASLGEEEDLTVQPPHVVDNPADNGFHRFIIT